MGLKKLKGKMLQSYIAIIILELLFIIGIIYLIDWFFDALIWFEILDTGFYIPYPIDLPWAFLAVGLFFFIQWGLGAWSVEVSMKPTPINKGENPWLENTVKEIAEKSEIPPPKLKIIDMPNPNAFVYGRTLSGASLVVTTGLLNSLNKDEIKAVIGHEIGHLRHRDVIIMTLAAGVPLLALLVLRGGFYLAYGMGRSSSKSDDKGGGLIILLILAIVALASAIFFLSLLAVRGLSRLREHYADSYSAYVTRDPRSMQSALAKITWGLSIAPKNKQSEGMRNLYIADSEQARLEVAYIRENREEFDLDKDGVLDEQELMRAMEIEAKKTKLSGLSAKFATHPPTYRRILLLKKIEKEFEELGPNNVDVYKHI
ncbi:MAG: M48 family metalloprotease [Candidatus Odinarchaeia archaeon]